LQSDVFLYPDSTKSSIVDVPHAVIRQIATPVTDNFHRLLRGLVCLVDWFSGNYRGLHCAHRHSSIVTLHRARLVVRCVTVSGVYGHDISHFRRVSRTPSLGNERCRAVTVLYGRNGEFCLIITSRSLRALLQIAGKTMRPAVNEL